MGDLTKNISRHELCCKCERHECNVTILDDEPIIQVVQRVCDLIAQRYDVPRVVLEITSAARCYEHNRDIGSTDNSRHPRGCAMDIKIFIPITGRPQVPPSEVAEAADLVMTGSGGIGVYPTFTHIDTRRSRGRW